MSGLGTQIRCVGLQAPTRKLALCACVRRIGCLLFGLSFGLAWADDEPSLTKVSVLGDRQPVDAKAEFDVVVVHGPRLTVNDVLIPPLRSLAGYREEVTELRYRWSTTTGRAALEVVLGSVAYVVRPDRSDAGPSAQGPPSVVALRPLLGLGLRYHTAERSALYADATGPGLGLDESVRVVSKVSIELKAAQSRWDVAYGDFGFRLTGNSRMSLRVHRGGFSVGMRGSF